MSSSPAHGCPLCAGAAQYAFTAADRNRASTPERFDYWRCADCATVFLVDPPADLAPHYVSGYYDFDAAGEPRWRSNPDIVSYQRERADLVLSHAGTGPLIDVGAGSGAFAAAAEQSGFEVSAIEMDPTCCEYMRRALNVSAICSDRPIEALAELPPARAITLWHVLEHLVEPARMLAQCAAQLEPGGVLALGLPNPESIQFRILGTRWVHLDAPRHVCLIPAAAIIAACRPLGLRAVELSTDDAVGRGLNAHGWVSALQRRSVRGAPSRAHLGLGAVIGLALAPVERRPGRGSAYTLLLRKDDGEAAR